jgi:hypothetical protein
MAAIAMQLLRGLGWDQLTLNQNKYNNINMVCEMPFGEMIADQGKAGRLVGPA